MPRGEGVGSASQGRRCRTRRPHRSGSGMGQHPRSTAPAGTARGMAVGTEQRAPSKGKGGEGLDHRRVLHVGPRVGNPVLLHPLGCAIQKVTPRGQQVAPCP